MKVKLARLSMEGSTIHWFNLLMETEDDLPWEKLKKGLIARYGGRRLENPFEELATLKQSGNVEEFVEAFELLSSQVGCLPEDQYLGYFMTGLKPQIRRRVRTLNPQNRMQMMRIAKDVEEELKEDDDESGRYSSKKGVQERFGRNDWAGSLLRSRSGFNPKETNKSNPSPKTGSTGSNTASMSSLASTGKKGENKARSEKWKGIRNIHYDEMAERRANGLCFKCGGKYHPTLHKCPERSLRVLILGEGESLNDEGKIIAMEEVQSEGEDEDEVECNSMGVLGSLGEHRTMKIEGKIGNVDVLMLLDSGASHCFISPQVTNALGLEITPEPSRRIKLGDGYRVPSLGVCKGIVMSMGSVKICIDAIVFELSGLDVVLGMSWLNTLGEVLMDWKALSMQFMYEGKMVKVLGQGSKQEEHSYLNTFLGDKQGRVGMDWWWSQHHQLEGNKVTVPKELLATLEQYPAVFKDHIQLPPKRSQVHHIKLLPNHGAVNVRPYRYLHHQKEEIERQVAELLQAGVIRPSMSEFSSPVILVKKKDKSWWRCGETTILLSKNVSGCFFSIRK